MAVVRINRSGRWAWPLKRETAVWTQVVGWAAVAAIALGAVGAVTFGIFTWWLNFSQTPEKSDIIVVLSGSVTRSAYGADLYKNGLAGEVWISQPKAPMGNKILRELEIAYPTEEEINRQVLIRKGVPANRVVLYGRDVNSTVDEARALRERFPTKGKRITIVTSAFHARRSLVIFRREIPDADIRVSATPYDPPANRWWRSKELIGCSFLEFLKLPYYLLGLRFVD